MKKFIYGVLLFAIAGIVVVSCEKTEKNEAEIEHELVEENNSNNRVADLPDGCVSNNVRCQGECEPSNWRGSCGDDGGCCRIKGLDGEYRYECWTNETAGGRVTFGFDKPNYSSDIHHFDIMRSIDGGTFEPFLIDHLATEYSAEGLEDSDAIGYATLEYEIMFFSEPGELLGTITWLSMD